MYEYPPMKKCSCGTIINAYWFDEKKTCKECEKINSK